jgi:glycosyltransferase involved in cell wall biosynthesis
MRILYLSNHFALLSQPGAPRPWHVARYLARMGHDVTVLTNHRHYLDENLPVGSTDYTNPQVVAGVRIIGLETTAGRRKSLFGRLLNYAAFAVSALLTGRRLPPQDMLIVGTPPLLAPVTGLVLGWLWKAFAVLEIRDLHPEKAHALGKVRNPLLYRLWQRYEAAVRRLYDHLVAVEPSTRRALVRQGYRSSTITLIANGFDVEHLTPARLPSDIEHLFEAYADHAKITYGGGMGFGNNIQTILDSAVLCRQRPMAFFLFGEGECKSQYERFVQQNGLAKVHLLSPIARNMINEVFRRSDILVYSTIDDPFFDGLFTNKILEYHGAGKPIVFSGRGDTADLIRAAGSGVVVPPKAAAAMAAAYCELMTDPAAAAAMGHGGKAYIMRHWRRETTFKHWRPVVELARRHHCNHHHA